jgi:hypothetical protein
MRVEKVGIEIEGAFKKTFDDGTDIHHDGSLCTELPPGLKEWSPRGHLGEVTSLPLPPGEVEKWILEHYPDSANHLCGLHVHVSFGEENARGVMFCSHPGFYPFFLKEMEKWGQRENLPKDSQFWPRLQGKNTYCKKAFIPSVQVRRTGKEFGNSHPQRPVKQGGDRYCQLNFCWGLHGTIEARLLPTFPSAKTAVSGVKKVIGIFDEWLKSPPELRVAKMVVSLKEGVRVEAPREEEKKEEKLREQEALRLKKEIRARLLEKRKKKLAPGMFTGFGAGSMPIQNNLSFYESFYNSSPAQPAPITWPPPGDQNHIFQWLDEED